MKTAWSIDELRKIAEADDLHVSRFREDGMRAFFVSSRERGGHGSRRHSR